MTDVIRFKHPFTCIISGPTGSGKSSFCVRFLQNLRSVCTETSFAGGLFWCFSEKTAVPELGPLQRTVRFHEGLPDFRNERGHPCLYILDDLLNDVYSKQVCDLFTKGSHHRNISVILITQNLFHQGPYCRDISLNATYLVLLKNVRDRKQFMYLARQVYPEHSDSLFNAYVDATRHPHSFFVLDFEQSTPDRFRYRTRIFPDEAPPVIYAAQGD